MGGTSFAPPLIPCPLGLGYSVLSSLMSQGHCSRDRLQPKTAPPPSSFPNQASQMFPFSFAVLALWSFPLCTDL